MKMNKIVIIPLLVLVVLVIGTSYAFYTKTSETNRQITLKTGKTYIGIYGENKENIELNKDYTFTIENRGSIGSGYEVYIESETNIDLSSISYTVTGDYSKTGNLSDNVLVYSALSSIDSKTINIKLTSTSTDSYKGKIKVRYKDYVVNYDYTGAVQTFNVPTTGNYKLETWGAQGGNVSGMVNYTGAVGGYSIGKINLEKNTTIYTVVGGQGTSITNNNVVSTTGSSYNGGGPKSAQNSTVYYGSGGGGATHMAFDSGLLSELSSHATDGRILIVAGGGGGSSTSSTTVNNATTNGVGGTGGGFKGTKGSTTYSGSDTRTPGDGGTQTTAGASYSTVSTYTAATFGQGCIANKNYGSYMRVSGGGGYYGGGCGIHSGGGGGSGYIANSSLTDKKMVCFNCTTSTAEATKTESNTCLNSNPTADCSKVGNGYARITYIGN